MEIETTNIILIVAVALIILERIYKCVMRIRKSKCCGGEIELSTPPKQDSLNSSENLQKTTEEVETAIKRMSNIRV